jgi:hypothetical protein
MSYVTYQLRDGAFATSSVQVPADYVRAWAISDEDAAHIHAGGDVRVEGDALIVTPPSVAEYVADPPQDGEF